MKAILSLFWQICLLRASPAYVPTYGWFVAIVVLANPVCSMLISLAVDSSIGGVRIAARRTSTQSLMRNVRVAIDAFQADNGRLPGYFSPVEMGSAENGSGNYRGFTAMENAILELALPGDIERSNDSALELPADDNFNVDVGPFDELDFTVRIDTSAFGNESL